MMERLILIGALIILFESIMFGVLALIEFSRLVFWG